MPGIQNTSTLMYVCMYVCVQQHTVHVGIDVRYIACNLSIENGIGEFLNKWNFLARKNLLYRKMRHVNRFISVLELAILKLFHCTYQYWRSIRKKKVQHRDNHLVNASALLVQNHLILRLLASTFTPITKFNSKKKTRNMWRRNRQNVISSKCCGRTSSLSYPQPLVILVDKDSTISRLEDCKYMQ